MCYHCSIEALENEKREQQIAARTKSYEFIALLFKTCFRYTSHFLLHVLIKIISIPNHRKNPIPILPPQLICLNSQRIILILTIILFISIINFHGAKLPRHILYTGFYFFFFNGQFLYQIFCFGSEFYYFCVVHVECFLHYGEVCGVFVDAKGYVRGGEMFVLAGFPLYTVGHGEGGEVVVLVEG